MDPEIKTSLTPQRDYQLFLAACLCNLCQLMSLLGPHSPHLPLCPAVQAMRMLSSQATMVHSHLSAAITARIRLASQPEMSSAAIVLRSMMILVFKNARTVASLLILHINVCYIGTLIIAGETKAKAKPQARSMKVGYLCG